MIPDFLETSKWRYIHRRERTPFYTFLLWNGSTKHLNSELLFPYELNGILYLGQDISMREDAWLQMHVTMTSLLSEDSSFLLKLIQKSYQINTVIENLVIPWQTKDWSRVEPSEIVTAWQEYFRLIDQFSAYLLLPLFLEADMESKLSDALKAILGSGYKEAFQVLTTPIKGGVAIEEQLRMLQLASDPTENAFEQHLQDFAWLSNSVFNGRFMTMSELRQRTEKLPANPDVELVNVQAKNTRHIEAFTRLRELFKDDFSLLNLIDTLQESIYFRSWRTERYYRNAEYLQSLIKQTANLLKISNDDFYFLTPPEIITGLEENILPDHYLERKMGYGIYADNALTYVFQGSEMAEWKEGLQLNLKEEQILVKGQVAFPGIVRGKVRVVLNKNDLQNIKLGEILVTPSTTVDYVPVLHSVVGIITDEGGVLSHASVISRELRIPCIIGTRQGTSLLKTGELIELNATTGTIQRVE